MYELYVPTDRYEGEIHKLKQAIDSIDDNKELVIISRCFPAFANHALVSWHSG